MIYCPWKRYGWQQIREWRCHGFIWQLILAMGSTKRQWYRPICPVCGAKGTV